MHEKRETLSEKTLNMKRAIDSLKEELEAIDWYSQRIDACTDDNLRKVLQHNADEEKEHAAMLLEWMQQSDPKFSEELKDYLFSDAADITSLEEGQD
ncbi:MAG: ferritin [Nanoarchaeota archaeon]